MDNTDFSSLAQYLPAKYIAPVTGALVLLGIIGRIYHAMQGGATFITALLSTFKGTNTPTAKEQAIATASNPQPQVPLTVPTDTKSAAVAPLGSLVGTLQSNPGVPAVNPPTNFK